MIIEYHPFFVKHYNKRILPNASIKKRFEERIRLFAEDKNNPLLRNHPLTGDLKGFYSFSISGDIRVVYKVKNKSTVLFYDVGTHNQVYK